MLVLILTQVLVLLGGGGGVAVRKTVRVNLEFLVLLGFIRQVFLKGRESGGVKKKRVGKCFNKIVNSKRAEREGAAAVYNKTPPSGFSEWSNQMQMQRRPHCSRKERTR